MKTRIPNLHRSERAAGVSLIETLVAMAVTTLVAVGLYLGISAGFTVVEVSRENLRATQILLEKMETIRLYSWDQINSNGFVPTSFTAPFMPGRTNSGTNNLVYEGRVTIADVGGSATPFTSETYTNSMRMVIVDLTWRSAGRQHSRQMRTYLSRYGLQNYVY